MARLLDGGAELVWFWNSVTWDDWLYGRYEVGLLWHGTPVLNPAVVGSSIVRPGFVSAFHDITPGFVPGADHDGCFLTAFKRALLSDAHAEYDDVEPWTIVQFYPRGIGLAPQDMPIEPGDADWRTFDLLVLLTPYGLRQPPGREGELGMGAGSAPAFYMTPKRAAAEAFFFDLLTEYLALLSPEHRREGAADLGRLLEGVDVDRQTLLRDAPGLTSSLD